MSPIWIELVKALAWPLVALGTLVYVWRSDAIGKLLRISQAVEELRKRLGDLAESEERLTRSTGAISEATSIASTPDSCPPAQEGEGELFAAIEAAWLQLSSALDKAFGWFDKRKTGSEAYRFAHGNRKGAKLSYDQADEIARLHSSIKSYRRRQGTMSDWLDPETSKTFVAECNRLVDELARL